MQVAATPAILAAAPAGLLTLPYVARYGLVPTMFATPPLAVLALACAGAWLAVVPHRRHASREMARAATLTALVALATSGFIWGGFLLGGGPGN
jgi:hypothetical protein